MSGRTVMTYNGLTFLSIEIFEIDFFYSVNIVIVFHVSLKKTWPGIYNGHLRDDLLPARSPLSSTSIRSEL
jgi:hypothetical protein